MDSVKSNNQPNQSSDNVDVPRGYTAFAHALDLHPSVVAGFGKQRVDETFLNVLELLFQLYSELLLRFSVKN